MEATTNIQPSPGPWQIRFGGGEADDGFCVADRDGRPVAEFWPAGMLASERPQVRANARLIEKAPDLEACLRRLRDWAYEASDNADLPRPADLLREANELLGLPGER